MLFFGELLNDGGVQVHLYKDSETRRFVNLDEAGHAYRFTVDRTRSYYQPHADLLSAIRALQQRSSVYER